MIIFVLNHHDMHFLNVLPSLSWDWAISLSVMTSANPCLQSEHNILCRCAFLVKKQEIQHASFNRELTLIGQEQILFVPFIYLRLFCVENFSGQPRYGISGTKRPF